MKKSSNTIRKQTDHSKSNKIFIIFNKKYYNNNFISLSLKKIKNKKFILLSKREILFRLLSPFIVGYPFNFIRQKENWHMVWVQCLINVVIVYKGRNNVLYSIWGQMALTALSVGLK